MNEVAIFRIYEVIRVQKEVWLLPFERPISFLQDALVLLLKFEDVVGIQLQVVLFKLGL